MFFDGGPFRVLPPVLGGPGGVRGQLGRLSGVRRIMARVRGVVHHPPAWPVEAHLWTESDVDYVDLFRQLVALVFAMRKTVPTVPVLLRRGLLEFRLGNFPQARNSAGDALILDEQCQEARWLHAMACLANCEVRLGLLISGPGRTVHEAKGSALDDLDDARKSLSIYVRRNQRRDEEACALLDVLDGVASARCGIDALREALRDLPR